MKDKALGGKSHCMFTLLFHFSLNILGNTLLSWTSSDMTPYVFISFESATDQYEDG